MILVCGCESHIQDVVEDTVAQKRIHYAQLYNATMETTLRNGETPLQLREGCIFT